MKRLPVSLELSVYAVFPFSLFFDSSFISVFKLWFLFVYTCTFQTVERKFLFKASQAMDVRQGAKCASLKHFNK